MRLTCPACAAAYELPDDRLPAGGAHVQCSACHTRWFARAAGAGHDAPSEDDILARLARRAAAAPEPLASPPAPIAFPRPARTRPALAAEPTPPSVAGPPESAQSEPSPPVRAAPEIPPAAAATPLRPRPGAERPFPAPPPTPDPARGRGGTTGFLLSLALAAAGLGAYLGADALAARAPAAAPALAAYVERIDAARVWFEGRVGPLRDRLAGP
jgi:predicted Zn finger-like uncharacterized protein